jgi:hypothetical protein
VDARRELVRASVTAADTNWSATLSSPLPSGKHVFIAFAQCGEERSASVVFDVDTEPPELTIAAPASPSSNLNPTFSGTASENTEVVAARKRPSGLFALRRRRSPARTKTARSEDRAVS